ncbi:iron chelate uptake ABC transporter family permease subunit [Phytomonospora sp. NPDC050363]|uniref:FecCD family ABC transporter permease n=1 Tax=Phytomonospora sp. NPDC050363 TaxID=3155642 RepID=UPI0033F14BC2
MKTSIDLGRPTLALRTRAVSGRLYARSLLVCAALLALGAVLAVVALGLGDYPVAPADVVSVFFGGGRRAQRLVVLDWRMPRVLLALMLGAAMGVAGAVFQSLTRNPLGSPDIIGFNTGAYTGALVAILLIGGGYCTTAAASLAGGLGTAALVYLLAYRRGVAGFRLIIVGMAIGATLASINTWLIVRASLDLAMAAAVWGAGSLNALGWAQVVPVAFGSIVLFAVLFAVAPGMRMLEMGDDAARSLGVRAEPVRLTLLVLGVGLTALATAAAGPVAFVALAAPQVARRLVRSSSVPLVASGILGAVLLLGADVVAQRAFAPAQLPVGVVTVSVGGVYLVWLLWREAARR